MWLLATINYMADPIPFHYNHTSMSRIIGLLYLHSNRCTGWLPAICSQHLWNCDVTYLTHDNAIGATPKFMMYDLASKLHLVTPNWNKLVVECRLNGAIILIANFAIS